MTDINSMSSFSCGDVQKSSYGRRGFPSPYLDYTSTYVWKSLTELFDWAEFSYVMTPELREAMRRLVSPFVTPLRLSSTDPDNKPLSQAEIRKWDDLLRIKLQWPLHAFNTLMNVAFYGNDFISVVAKTDRWLKCPDCGRAQPIRLLDPDTKLNYRKGDFIMPCKAPSCRRGGLASPKSHTIQDAVDRSPVNFRIKHWSVRHIVLRYRDSDDVSEIFYNVPTTIKTAVEKGDLLTLATVDLGMLEALDKKTLFKFHQDRIFHAKEPCLSGVRSNGWGLARISGLHKQSWLLHQLRKTVQSVAVDMDVPIKVVSPAEQPVGATGRGPMSSVPFSEFSTNFNRIINSHRTEPTRWHSLPSPITAQYLGGQANNLFPHQMLTMTKEDLVDAAGLPIELYKGSLSANASPMGLRLFEVQNGSLSTILNAALAFVTERVASIAHFDAITAEHEQVKLVDDMQTLSLIAQLSSAGNLSMSETLRRLNIDPRDDLHKQMQEQKMRQEFQARMEETMQKAEQRAAVMQSYVQPQLGAPGQPAPPPQDPAAAAASPPAAAPVQGQLPSLGFVPPANVAEWEQSAMDLASQLVMMPDAQRSNELKILREKYNIFHAIVVSRMDQIKYQQGVQARSQVYGV
jgi:hypothetical protein